jgi:hypothetical protein
MRVDRCTRPYIYTHALWYIYDGIAVCVILYLIRSKGRLLDVGYYTCTLCVRVYMCGCACVCQFTKLFEIKGHKSSNQGLKGLKEIRSYERLKVLKVVATESGPRVV